MPNSSLSADHYSPGVLSLLPLFYVAWADRMLTPAEVRLLRSKVKQLEFLDSEELAMLEKWSLPSNPPSRELFQQWRILLLQHAENIPDQSKHTLTELGLQMAAQSTGQLHGTRWHNRETREALEQLESMLTGGRGTHVRNLFQDAEPAEVNPESLLELQRWLDGEHRTLRQQLRSLLSDPLFQYLPTPEKEAHRKQVLTWCHELASRGLGSLAYPEAYGGKNNIGLYAEVFEMLGYHDGSLAIKFGVQFGLFGGSIQALGTEPHHARYLEKVASLELPGCFAMTETGHGSNVRGLETTATYQPEDDSILVHTPHEGAGKEYIGNALDGRMATVFAQLIVKGENHGVHAVLVPLRDEQHQLLPDIRIEDCGYKMGLNGVDNGRIWFNQVRVPRENLLNRFGNISDQGEYSSPIESPSRRFFTMLSTLVAGRVCVPRAGLSAAKVGLTIAIRYGLQRRQFGPDALTIETLLLDYPSHQRRLLPLLAGAYAWHIALEYTTKRYLNQSESDAREIETLAAAMKSAATWFTTRTLQACREACGGKGYLSENRFAQLKSDTDIYTTFEGDNTVLMQLVAKGLLTAFQQEFHEEGMVAVMRHLGRRLAADVTQRNPIIVRNTDPEHLRDAEFQLNAFEYRENRLLQSLAQRLRALIKSGKNAYEASLECQTHMLALGDAYAHRVVLQQFIEKEQENTLALKPVLQLLRQLFALSVLEAHRGWYLESGYMEGVKTKAVRREVDRLCEEIRPHAGALVNAFAIPDAVLAAPIALP